MLGVAGRHCTEREPGRDERSLGGSEGPMTLVR